ncbi:MAG: hypothetical protein ACKPKO_10090, partial [Candidatus Fonsibacter sp.]
MNKPGKERTRGAREGRRRCEPERAEGPRADGKPTCVGGNNQRHSNGNQSSPTVGERRRHHFLSGAR